MLSFFILTLTLFFAPKVFSVTLEEIKTSAHEHSASLKAQDMESHALASESKLKGKWQNPQLMIQYGTLKFGNASGSTTEISLTQPVPLSDKYSLKRELADQALKAQAIQKGYFTNWVEHQAVLAAWKVLIAKELYNHGIERAERINIIQKYLDTHPKVSLKQKVEFSIISSLVLQLLKMQDEKKHELIVAENELSFWTGKRLTAKDLEFGLPSDNKVYVPAEERYEADADYLEAKNQLKISQIDSELAAKERRPDLFLGGGFRQENGAPQNRFTYAIVGINIPIWDTGSQRAESARTRELRDEKNLEEAARKVSLKHQKQKELVAFHLGQIKRFPKKLLKVQEKSIHLAEAGFKQGVLDVNTFLQAETQTHDVIDQIFVSWLNYLESLSSLQLMRGEGFVWETK